MTRLLYMLMLAALLTSGDAIGKTFRPMPPPPRPTAPIPAIKPDPAALEALAAEEERVARKLRMERGR